MLPGENLRVGYLDGMTGLELRHRLKHSGCNLPVVFITAVDDEKLELEGIQSGCLAYLHKPFPASLLIAAVAKALGEHPAD